MHIWQQIYLYQPEKIGIWQYSLQWTELPHIATNICQAKDVAAADASGCLGKPHVPLTLSPSIPANKIITNQWSQVKVWWKNSAVSAGWLRTYKNEAYNKEDNGNRSEKPVHGIQSCPPSELVRLKSIDWTSDHWFTPPLLLCKASCTKLNQEPSFSTLFNMLSI